MTTSPTPAISPEERGRIADALITHELARRESRIPDYASENHVLVALGAALTGPHEALLQSFADAALSLCASGSAGISLLETSDSSDEVFRWSATSGIYASQKGNVTPRQGSPSGVTVDHGAPQMFDHPQSHFPSLPPTEPEAAEGLFVPISGDGSVQGTIWVMSHGPGCRFSSEDVRLLTNLARFAGGALSLGRARRRAAEEATRAQAAHRTIVQAERRRDEFIAMLGHELRNPMAPIDSAIGASRRLCAGNVAAVEILTLAQRQMRQLRALVDDLLDAARLEHGKLLVRTTSTSLNEIVVDAVTAVQHHFEARKHTLTLTGLDGPIHVRADHVRLSQVLGNILSNAAKYTPAGGAIELIARTASSAATSDTEERLKTIEVTVRDNGIGIGPDILPHVFELFTQAPSTNARSAGGLGIGLAVAKRLVELHNGSIAIDSRGAGRGTVVTVRLPIVVNDPESSRPVWLDAAPLIQGTRLLLVDDNRDALDALSTLLELEGFQVLTSNTGQDAIRIVAEQLPDLAIVDIGMPVMDGFEVASIIRSHPELDNVVLIALTGYAAESDKSRALASGFDYHFTKPLSLERLRDMLSDRRAGNSRRLV